MTTPIRLPQAPTQSAPALADFLRPFRVHFARSEGPHALDRYLTGLLTDLPNKNCDTIAQAVPDTSEQELQGLLTAMAWNQDDLNRQRVQRMRSLPTEGDAVLIFDDTGFAKQGKCSVGVARQYSGTLGKVGNCQVSVNCHYAERTVAWPVATRLYLPKDWANDPDRRQQAHVPVDVAFQTKPEIALDLLDQAQAWELRWACVTADADYGDNPNFLAGLEQRRQRYVVAVRADFAVALQRRGRACRCLGAGPAGQRLAVGALARREQRLAPGALRPDPRLADPFGWPAAVGVAARRTHDRRQAQVLLEQFRSDGGVGVAGGIRAPAALGGAVSPGSQGVVGLGSVSGPVVAGLPPACGQCDAGVQLLGLARMAAAPGADSARATPGSFFPLGTIGGAGRCRQCIGRSATGCVGKAPRSCCCVNS